MQKAFYKTITTTALLLAVILIGSTPVTAQVTFSFGDATGRPGESISVPVRVSGVEGGTAIQAFGFTVNHDAGITFTGHSTTGTLASTAGFTVESNPANGGVGGFSTGTTIDESGVLIMLNFDLDTESSGVITLTNVVLNGGDPAVVGPFDNPFTVADRIMAISEGSVSHQVVDQNFEIIIFLEDALLESDDAVSFNFDLNYDASLMSINSAVGSNGVVASGITSDANVSGNDIDANTFRVAGFTTGADFVGDGEFIRIAATTTSQTGVGNLSLSSVNFNADGAPPFYAGAGASLGVSTDTADEEETELPSEFALRGNYPNPFNPSTTVQFDLPETADVQVQVSDLLGRLVMTIPSQTMQAGTNKSIQINAATLSSGIYVYRIIARGAGNTHVRSNTMTLIK